MKKNSDSSLSSHFIVKFVLPCLRVGFWVCFGVLLSVRSGIAEDFTSQELAQRILKTISSKSLARITDVGKKSYDSWKSQVADAFSMSTYAIGMSDGRLVDAQGRLFSSYINQTAFFVILESGELRIANPWSGPVKLNALALAEARPFVASGRIEVKDGIILDLKFDRPNPYFTFSKFNAGFEIEKTSKALAENLIHDFQMAGIRFNPALKPLSLSSDDLAMRLLTQFRKRKLIYPRSGAVRSLESGDHFKVSMKDGKLVDRTGRPFNTYMGKESLLVIMANGELRIANRYPSATYLSYIDLAEGKPVRVAAKVVVEGGYIKSLHADRVTEYPTPSLNGIDSHLLHIKETGYIEEGFRNKGIFPTEFCIEAMNKTPLGMR